MTTPIARLGDTIDHGGTIITASPTWKCNSIPIARVGDEVMCFIHGLQTITTGSPAWTVDGRAMARIGSSCSCGAVINSGSPNWKVS